MVKISLLLKNLLHFLFDNRLPIQGVQGGGNSGAHARFTILSETEHVFGEILARPVWSDANRCIRCRRIGSAHVRVLLEETPNSAPGCARFP